MADAPWAGRIVVSALLVLAACSDAEDRADAGDAAPADTPVDPAATADPDRADIPVTGAIASECSPERFASRAGNPLSCCQSGNRTWHTLDGQTLAARVFAPPCSEADGTGTECGEDCVYGPCGAQIELLVSAEAVHIFHPISDPEACGWAVHNVRECRIGCDWAVGDERADPEPFLDQQEYPGVTSACEFTFCLAGGVPAL